MRDPIVILSTVPSKKEGKKIATLLVEKKLAACVQVVSGVMSTYFWEGKICRDKEFLLIIKSRKALFSKLVSTIQKHHSYKVPEIIALPIAQGSSMYLQWMKRCLNSK